jgi:hypothetical protein
LATKVLLFYEIPTQRAVFFNTTHKKELKEMRIIGILLPLITLKKAKKVIVW